MKKMAIFVEGFTELLFVEKLIEELAGKQNVRIEKIQRSGQKGRRKSVRIDTLTPENGQRHYFQVVDCRGFSTVNSDVHETYNGLVAANFSAILAMRDLHPNKRSEINALRAGFRFRLKSEPVNPAFVLAIMESETWFLAEHTHLLKVSPVLSPEFINQQFKMDLRHDDLTLIGEPAEQLDAIYRAVGSAYVKGTRTTLDMLDFSSLIYGISQNHDDLRHLINEIHQFMYESPI